MTTATRAADPQALTAGEARREIRAGRWTRHTAGLAPGKLQCNLVVLPEAWALDFLRFCLRNPKPCPIVGVTDTGDPRLPGLGPDIDLRTDVPRYRVHENGEAVTEPTDITRRWREDFVGVALGCSFTFEHALMAAGIGLPNVERDVTVPMYRTTIPLAPAGPFRGSMVVSMRPIPTGRVEEASRISARYPHAHGAPVHVGDPAAIGIADLSAPDWGEATPPAAGETPVFWACGVTPQNVLLAARPPICITHAPGHMLITDLDERAGLEDDA